MSRLLRRVKAAIRTFKGDDELQQRALSFSCSVLQTLESHTTWSERVVHLIAMEAIQRQLAHADEFGRLGLTADGYWLCQTTPVRQ